MYLKIRHRYILFVSITTKVIASLLGSELVDRKGREAYYTNAALFFLLDTAVSALAPTWYIFITERVFFGIGIGFSIVSAPVYISEISPKLFRGGADFNIPTSIWSSPIFGHSHTYQVQRGIVLTILSLFKYI